MEGPQPLAGDRPRFQHRCHPDRLGAAGRGRLEPDVAPHCREGARNTVLNTVGRSGIQCRSSCHVSYVSPILPSRVKFRCYFFAAHDQVSYNILTCPFHPAHIFLNITSCPPVCCSSTPYLSHHDRSIMSLLSSLKHLWTCACIVIFVLEPRLECRGVECRGSCRRYTLECCRTNGH